MFRSMSSNVCVQAIYASVVLGDLVESFVYIVEVRGPRGCRKSSRHDDRPANKIQPSLPHVAKPNFTRFFSEIGNTAISSHVYRAIVFGEGNGQPEVRPVTMVLLGSTVFIARHLANFYRKILHDRTGRALIKNMSVSQV